MIFRTTLKAGQTNVLNKTGRHFYLLTAADEVRVRFRDGTNHTVDFESPLREGMSADFAVGIDEITLTTETAQYIEFWLGETKLDYSKLAAGGASANIQAGRAWAGLGESLAIPLDFRRKKITVMPLGDNVSIGGADISLSNSWPLQKGVEKEINSRGDIYTYVQPASIGGWTGVVTPFGTTAVSYPTGIYIDEKTGNFLLLANDKIRFALSGDENNFIDASINWNDVDSNGYRYMGAVGDSHYVLSMSGGFKGRIFRSDDGFASWYFTESASPPTYPHFLNIYDGWVSPDGGVMIVTGRSKNNGSYNSNLITLVSFDGFKTFTEYLGKSTPAYGFSDINQLNATEFLIRDDTDGIYKLTLGQGLELITNEVFLDLKVAPKAVFGLKNGFNTVLYKSIDGGYTFSNITTAEINAHNAKRIEVIGKSLILVMPKSLGLISDFEKSIQVLAMPTGEVKPVNSVGGESIAIKGTTLYFTPYLAAPADVFFQKLDLSSITNGALKGVTLQWLAELN